jgi:hypothetical protein
MIRNKNLKKLAYGKALYRKYKYAYGGNPQAEAIEGAGNAAASTALNLALPGAGTAYNAITGLSNSATMNADGTYKSTGAMVLNYATNPMAFNADVLSGDVGNKGAVDYKKEQDKIAQDKALEVGKNQLAADVAGGYSQQGFDNVTYRKYGGKLKKFPDGGKPNLIPISWNTNTQNTTDNTKVAEPVRPLPKLTKAEVERRKQFYEKVKLTTEKNEIARKKKVVEERKARINDSVEAQKVPYTTDNFADLTARLSQATGDKFRVSNEENIFDDYINPFAMVGSMASGLGQVPLDIKQGKYGDAALKIATPLVAGAVGGIGAKTTGQFVNNMVNPFAGMGVRKISKELTENTLKEASQTFSKKINSGFRNDPYYHYNAFMDKKGEILDNLRTPEGKARLQGYINNNPRILQQTGKKDVDGLIEHFANTDMHVRAPQRNAADTDWIRDDLGIAFLPVDPSNAHSWYMNGTHNANKIAMGNNFTPYDAQHILEHEFAHTFQYDGLINGVDDVLDDITLKQRPSIFNKLGKYNPFFKKDLSYSSTNKLGWNNSFKKQKNYWKTNQERAAHASEVRANLLERGILENRYDEITPKMLKEHYRLYNNTGGNKYQIRLYNIMQNKDYNFKTLASVLNKMPAVAPVAGGTALGAAYYNSRNPANLKQNKFGGMIKYPNGGNINMKNNKYFSYKRAYGQGAEISAPEYEVEGQEVVQGQDVNLENQENLSSNMALAKGPTHEQGGVEGEGGERVYSNRLKVSPMAYAKLKSLGFKVKPKQTYGKVATILGRKEGLFEDKKLSGSAAGNKTSELMLAKINGAKDLLFEDQEMQKNPQMEMDESQEELTMAYGGGLTKYVNGGGPIKKGTTYRQTADEATDYNTSGTFPGTDYLGRVLDVEPVPRLGYKGYKPVTTPAVNKDVVSAVGANVDLPSNEESAPKDYSAAIGAGVNALQYFTNLAELNKVKTDFNPAYPTVNYKQYNNRSGLALNQNQVATNTAIQGMRYSSSRGKNAAIGQLYAKSLDSSNQIVQGENLRRDAILADNIGTSNLYNANRTTLKNAADLENMNRKNELIATKMNARNAFLDGSMKQLREMRDTKYANDKNDADTEASQAEMKLMIMSNQNGVATRLAAKYGLDPNDTDAITDRWIRENFTMGYRKPKKSYGGRLK